MDLQAIIAWIVTALPVVVAIGWSVEKILRLLNDLTPETMKWDDNLADLLANILKALGGRNT